MQQRQPRLGDVLDDYCPRERRVTNHVVVAMVGQDVKQTRCTTCDADHEYKHAKVPRQRRKSEAPALLHPGAAGAPKRVVHEAPIVSDAEPRPDDTPPQTLNELVEAQLGEEERAASGLADGAEDAPNADEHDDDIEVDSPEEGPVHRPLIRATLPRTEGQPPAQRPAPEFTIRQPGGRPGRFRPRHQRGGQPFANGSNRTTGGWPQSTRGPQGSRGPHGPHGSRGGNASRPPRHQGRKRSK